MLDPGRYLAEAIYFLQYTLAQILWAVDRALLTIAVIADGVNSWLSQNIGYFVELLVNALSAPLGALLILALTALGAWYALNTIVATDRWVDPSKLATYGFIALAFFSAPLVVVDLLEELRTTIHAGIDQALIDGAAGDIFSAGMDGTDGGLPAGVPDVNSDGVPGSFDLATAFMHVANIDELDSNEFPADFEADYFPYGDPSSIELSDEADQQLAKALASQGIERLLFALAAIPTAIAEHFLHLALTGVAVLLYAGVPFAMLLAFFVYTQAFLGAYLRQFVNLLIETLMSVIIVAMMIGLLATAAQQGVGLYIGASLITLFVLLWRIKSALRLAAAALDLFGGGAITGGSGGMEMASMGRQAALGAVGVTAAALTGGATLAVGGAVMGAAAALQADGQRDGAYLGADPVKSEGRVAQLKTIAGYSLGRSQTVRGLIEGTHEVRMLGRNLRDGAVQEHEPDTLDYLRAGSSMSGFGSSPWLAMRLSPSLRAAYDEIGGARVWNSGHPLAYDELEDGAPVRTSQRALVPPASDGGLHDQVADLRDALAALAAALNATPVHDRGERPDAAVGEGIRETSEIWRERQAPARPDAPVEPQVRSGRGESEPRAGQDPPSIGGVRGVQDVRLVERATDLDQDGREDKYEINREQPGAGRGATPAGPTIILQPQDAARQQALMTTVAALQGEVSPARQAAYETVRTYAGEQNAQRLQRAVGEHGAPAVQHAAAAMATLARRYREEGLNEAAILTAFQQGQATAALRNVMETPLSDTDLAAVADMVLLPQRHVTRAELVAVIGEQVAAGNPTDEAIRAAIGAPVHLAGQTGNVRGVIAGAQAMQLSPEELTRLAALLRDGRWDVAQQELAAEGHPPARVHGFIADLAALPAVLSVPQTTARPQQSASDPANTGSSEEDSR